MSEPTTEAGRRLVRIIAIGPLTRDMRAGYEEATAAIEAEARADLARRVEVRVRGWLSDAMWPRFGPGIGIGPFDAGRMAARASAEQVLDTVREETAR